MKLWESLNHSDSANFGMMSKLGSSVATKPFLSSEGYDESRPKRDGNRNLYHAWYRLLPKPQLRRVSAIKRTTTRESFEQNRMEIDIQTFDNSDFDPFINEIWGTLGIDFGEEESEPRIWDLPPEDDALPREVPVPLIPSSVDAIEPPGELYEESIVPALPQRQKRFVHSIG
jgi:hypothetical protein